MIVTSGDPGLYWGPEAEWIVSPPDPRLGLWDAETARSLGSALNPRLKEALEWPAPQELGLQRLCSSSRDSWTWRVLNPNPFEVEVGWELRSADTRPGEQGIVVPAAKDGQPGQATLVTARQLAVDSLRFFTGSGGDWRADVTAGGIACTPVELPAEGP